jgi:septum formation protein
VARAAPGVHNAGVRIILASQSPRRLALLLSAGVLADVRPAHIDEAPLPGEAPRSLVARLAREKARAVPSSELVLGADTEVVLHDTVLGKPRDAAHAHAMLAQLSGVSHEVITGFCVRRGDVVREGLVSTRVRFRPLTAPEIARYVATGEPLDKAGAYGIQGAGGFFVDALEGSYTNVVGLPLHEVLQILREMSA